MKYLLLFSISLLLPFISSAQLIRFQENFNADTLPAGWTNTTVSGSDKWKIGLDGSNAQGSFLGDPGVNNIDGTRMLIFDDDSLGPNKTNNTVEISTPFFNNSKDVKSTLEFDYNFRSIKGVSPSTIDSFVVEVYDRLKWNTIFVEKNSNCGRYAGTGFFKDCIANPFPHAKIDLSPYKSIFCKIRFRYHDGNDWAFYVGVDNVKITHLDSNDIRVSKILYPYDSCGLGTKERVKVLLINNGINVVSNFEITADINDGKQQITEVVTDTIAFEDSLIYELKTFADFSKPDNYKITVFTTYNKDTLPLNDTTANFVRVDSLANLPYSESFEDKNHAWYSLDSIIEWGAPQSRLINQASDGFKVIGTNLLGTFNSSKQELYLYSPCISKPINNDALKISFDLFLNFSRAYLTTEYTIDQGKNWINIPRSNLSANWYNQGNNWRGNYKNWLSIFNIVEELSGAASIQFRFKYENFGQNEEGFALDNFSIDTLLNKDLTLYSVFNPRSTSSNLGLLYEKPIIYISNIGKTSVANFKVSYQVKGSSEVIESLNDTIKPLSILNYKFKDSIDFTEAKKYFINFKLDYTADQDTSNNNIFDYLIVQDEFVFDLPYKQDFNSFEKTFGSSSQVLELGEGWISEIAKRSLIDFYWTVGEASDINSIDRHIDYTGNKMMVTNQIVNPDIQQSTQAIISPFIYLNRDNIELSFSYYLKNILGLEAYLYLDIFDGKVWHNEVSNIHAVNSNPNISLQIKKVNLSSFKGKKVKLRFRYEHSGSHLPFVEGAHFIIDDVQLYSPIRKDVNLRSLTKLTDCLTDESTNTIKIQIQNLGDTTIIPNDVFLYYQLNDSQIVEDTLNTTLAVDSTLEFQFSDTLNNYGKAEKNVLKIWVAYPGDKNTFNDTLTINFTNPRIYLPYLQDFEDYNLKNCDDIVRPYEEDLLWYNRDWRIANHKICAPGLRNKLPTNNATYTSNQFAYTSFFSNYIENGIPRAIYSPRCGIILSSDSNSVITFDYYKEGAKSSDLFIQVLSPGGWVDIDSVIRRKQTNLSSPWQRKKVKLSNYQGYNKVRLATTRNNGSIPAISIDNLYFYNEIPADIGILDVLAPKSNCNLSSTEEVTVQVQNRGTTTITANIISAKLFLDDVLRATEQIPFSIPVDSIKSFIFSQKLDLSEKQQTYSLRVELELSGDSNTLDNKIKNYEIVNYKLSPTLVEDFE